MELFISLLAGLGLGSLITAFVSGLLEKRKATRLNLEKILEDKYRGLLIFMACALDIENKKFFTINEQVAQRSSAAYLEQVRQYYFHSALYSSDEVLMALKQFIKDPSESCYFMVAKSMRSDLWGRKTNLSIDDIRL